MDFVDCHIDVDCSACQFHKTREHTKDMTFEVAKVSYWPSSVHTERRLHWRSLKRWGEPSVGWGAGESEKLWFRSCAKVVDRQCTALLSCVGIKPNFQALFS